MSEATSTGTGVTGILMEKGLEHIVLKLPGTDYLLRLVIGEATAKALPEAGPRQRVTGVIHARARRVDVVGAGGRFIEPVFGRPRRVQGRVMATDLTASTITVKAACLMICELTAQQKANQFAEGMLVSFDVERGATFAQDATGH